MVGAPIGAVMLSVPSGAVEFRVGAAVFYRHGSAFFAPVDGGYEVVESPVGGIVDVLPMGYEIAATEPEELYYHEGVFYRYDPGRDASLIVEPPPGVEVGTSPSDAEATDIEGALVYTMGATRYRTVVRGRRTFYVVVRR